MLLATEPKRASDVLRYAASYYSEDEGVFIPGTYDYGTLLGQRTSDKAFGHWDPSATDGLQDVAGFALCHMVNDNPKKGIVIARHAVAAKNGIIFPDGLTPAQKEAGVSGLTTLGIVVRDGV